MVKQNGEREKILDKVLNAILKNLDSSADNPLKATGVRELLSALTSWGGKNKDEIIQMLCREIGVAIAAVLKEPLNQVIENRKLQITIELVERSKTPAKKARHRSKS